MEKIQNFLTIFHKKSVEQKSNLWFGAIFIFATTIVVWSITTQLNEKSITHPSGFWPIITNLVNGNGYSACYQEYFPFCSPNNQVSAMREPIPAFLLATGIFIYPSIQSFAIVQGLLYLGTTYTIYQILKKEDVRIALLATLLFATSVPVIQEIANNTGELTSAFFFSLAIYNFLSAVKERKIIHFFASGFFMGIASLSRTVFLGIALGWILFLALREMKTPLRNLLKPVLNISVFVITVCLVIVPWVIRNNIVFGQPVIGTTLTGYNIFRHHYYLNNEPFTPHYVGSEEGYQAVQQLIQNSNLTGTETEAEMDDFYMQAGKELILKNPVRYLAIVFSRVPMLWFNTGIVEANGGKLIKRDYIALVQQVFFLFAIIIGSIKFFKPYFPLVLSFVLACGAYVAIAAQMRYLVDIMPAIVILSALGVSTFFPRLFKE